MCVQPQSRIGAVAEHRRRQHAVVQRQTSLDERRNPRAALGVADVPLDRTKQTGLAAARLVDIAQRVGLDHVAEKSAGAVCFDEADLFGLDLRERERAAHQLHLRPAVRGGDPVAAAIVVGDRTLHHCVDRLAVGNGVVESAQHHRGHALATADAIGALSERFAATIRRGQPGLGVKDRKRRCEKQIRTGGDDSVGVPGAQRGTALVHGHQR